MIYQVGLIEDGGVCYKHVESLRGNLVTYLLLYFSFSLSYPSPLSFSLLSSPSLFFSHFLPLSLLALSPLLSFSPLIVSLRITPLHLCLLSSLPIFPYPSSPSAPLPSYSCLCPSLPEFKPHTDLVLDSW